MNSGTTETLYHVWGTSSASVYAVGNKGTILHYNGATWSAMDSNTGVDLFGIWGSSNNDIYAVGSYGTILHYNGATWSVITTESSVEAYLSVWGTSSNNVYISGGGGIILHYDGSSWSSPMSSGTSASLRCLWGSSNSDIYAVGDSGTTIHYNGTNWTAVTSGAYGQLQGIYGTSSNDVYAVGANTYVYHFNGSNWSSTEPGSSGLAGIWGTSPSNYFAVGWPSQSIWRYNGSTWTDMPNDATQNLFGVWGPCASEAFAVGMEGMILHYGNCGGATSTSFNTTLGTVNMDTNAGYITNVSWLAPVDVRCSNPYGYNFPYGMFSFNINNLTAGGTAIITLKFSNPLPLGTKYYKCINGSLADCTSLVTRINEYTLQIAITDGGLGDADSIRNGTIVDPGGPAFPLNNIPQSSSSSIPTTPQKPVSLSNISVKSASLSATKVAPGEHITVTANIANTGTGNGASVIKVYVNGSEDATQGVSVNSGSTSTVTFDVTRNEPGTYTVYVGGTQAGSFTVDQFTPNTILFISGALVFFALIIGIIYMTSRRKT